MFIQSLCLDQTPRGRLLSCRFDVSLKLITKLWMGIFSIPNNVLAHLDFPSHLC